MADEPHHHNQPQDLPQVLVLGPPTCFSILETLFSHNFHFLIPETSPLPLHQFLIDPSSIRAILCGANCSVTAEVLRLLPLLGIIVTTSVGTDHIDLAECRRHGIQVASAGSLFSEDVADVAVGLLIDVVTKISAADRYVRSRIPSGRRRFPLGSKVVFLFLRRIPISHYPMLLLLLSLLLFLFFSFGGGCQMLFLSYLNHSL